MTDSSSPQKGAQHQTPRHALRVLLVANPPASLCRMMSLHASRVGIEVKFAAGGSEAIALLNREGFDLALTEFHTPATCRALLNWMSQHPSSMLLCSTTSDVREEGFWAKIKPYLDDLLKKQFSIRELADRIKNTEPSLRRAWN